MSDKRKFPRAEALKVAEHLKAILEPFCERITIAGSIRREKPFVGDIELLFIPRMETRQVDLLTTGEVDVAAERIKTLVRDGVLGKRLNVNGSPVWGDKNKLAVHLESGIPVDLFSTTAENWWVSLVVRTGSKEMNLELTSGAIRLGRHLNAYSSGVTTATGTIQAHSEHEVFTLCGVPYREPNKR